MNKPLAFIIALFFTFCNNPLEDKVSETLNLNEDSYTDISIQSTENGILKSYITGKKLLRTKTPGTLERISEFKEGFEAHFYDSLGNLTTRVKAKVGIYNEVTKHIFMKDSVFIVTTRRDTFRADDLTYDNALKKFFTNNKIDIKRPNEHLKGIGFEGNSDLTVYKIFKPTGRTSSNTISF